MSDAGNVAVTYDLRAKNAVNSGQLTLRSSSRPHVSGQRRVSQSGYDRSVQCDECVPELHDSRRLAVQPDEAAVELQQPAEPAQHDQRLYHRQRTDADHRGEWNNV